MRKPFVTLLAALFALSLVLSACSKPSNNPDNTTKEPPAAGEAVKGGTFTMALTSDAANLNPILYQDTVSASPIGLIFDSLMRVNDKFEWRPWLAADHPKIENDGKKWTFKLRNDVTWHDGAKFTSKDVRFTFEAIQHPGYTGVRASNYRSLKGVADLRKAYSDAKDDMAKKLDAWENWRKNSGAIQTPDDYTVIFELDTTFAPMLSTMAGMGIIPEHLLKDQLGAPMKDSEFNRKPVGTGRYIFVDWKAQERIDLKVNEKWWGGRPNIDNIVMKVYPDSNTSQIALEKGEVDYAGIDFEQFVHFQGVKSVKVHEYPSTSYNQLTLDLNNDLFKDVKVRYALSHAIDKEGIVKQLLQGHGIVAHSHGTPTRWDYNADVPKFNYDKAKAESLLDEAGWKKGADGIRVKDGKKFSFELYYSTGDKTYEESVQVIQSNWKAIGIDANLKGVDFPTLLDLSDAGNPDRKQPPVYILGWSLGVEPDSTSIWTCSGSFNDIGYCNKRIDELMQKGKEELDQAKRKPIYAEIQKILAEDQPYIWLFFPNNIVGINEKVQGPIAGTPAGIMWNFEKWWIGAK